MKIQTKEKKDEDRGCMLARPLGASEDLSIPIAAYDQSAGILGMKRDPSVQTLPGWNNAPSNFKSHMILVEHLYLGLFDGHGGSAVADYLVANLHKEIERDNGFKAPVNDLSNLLTNVFMRVDQEICKTKVLLREFHVFVFQSLFSIAGEGRLNCAGHHLASFSNRTRNCNSACGRYQSNVEIGWKRVKRKRNFKLGERIVIVFFQQ